MRSSWVEVNLDALYHNAVYIKGLLSPGCRFLAPVKGNAYGFGLVPAAKVFEKAGAEYFGVAIPEEGKELREGGLTQPILIFGATFSDDYDLLFDYDLIPNLFRLDQARELSALAVEKGRTLTVHLSVDTGLTRLGFDYTDELPDIIGEICGLPGLNVEGIFSMLATSELYPERTYCDWQFRRFIELTDKLEARGVHIPIRHICDGGGTLAFPEMHLEMARPGTPLYGMLCGEPTAWMNCRIPCSLPSRSRPAWPASAGCRRARRWATAPPGKPRRRAPSACCPWASWTAWEGWLPAEAGCWCRGSSAPSSAGSAWTR